MIYRFLTALTFLVTTPFGYQTTGGSASEAQNSVTATDITENVNVQTLPDTSEVILQAQHATRKVPKNNFWNAVAWCETNQHWNDGGYYSGGLGMAHSVWVNYGGRQFANRPHKATKIEQIIVANRVAFLGFQTKNTYATLADRENNRPYFRPAVGWYNLTKWGKNCVNWKTRKPYPKYASDNVKR